MITADEIATVTANAPAAAAAAYGPAQAMTRDANRQRRYGQWSRAVLNFVPKALLASLVGTLLTQRLAADQNGASVPFTALLLCGFGVVSAAALRALSEISRRRLRRRFACSAARNDLESVAVSLALVELSHTTSTLHQCLAGLGITPSEAIPMVSVGVRDQKSSLAARLLALAMYQQAEELYIMVPGDAWDRLASLPPTQLETMAGLARHWQGMLDQLVDTAAGVMA